MLNKSNLINSSNIKYKSSWNLNLILSEDDLVNEDTLLKEVEENNYEFINKWKDRSDYLKDPLVLKEALDEFEKLMSDYGQDGKVGYYYYLRSHLDSSDKKIKAKLNKINDISTKIENDISFFTHRISKVDISTQKLFLESDLLSEYKHLLEGLFEESKYLLSEDEEKILNLKSKVSHYNWKQMLSEFISKEQEELIGRDGKKRNYTFDEALSLLLSKDKKVRDDAVEFINKVLEKYSDIAEHEINSILENKRIDDDLRKFDRPDLSRFISDDIKPQVVDILIDSVRSNFDLSRKYYEFKSKLLGVSKLKYHERNVEYGDLPNDFSFDDAVNIVGNTFGSLDKEFLDKFNSYLENGQIDVFPKVSKCGGAFCTHHIKSLPVFVLLNYTNTLNDLTTFAHEMGHALNNEYMKDQNSLNYGSPLSTAEVSSTFFENFVYDKVMETVDDEKKLYININILEDYISTIYRQTAAFLFEKDLHSLFREKGYLSKEEIGEIFQKHMKDYMGDYVEYPDESKNWWVYWSHFRSFFYVYSYVSGSLISLCMQNMVKNNKEDIVLVKKFLSSGSSLSPSEIFMNMGIDISSADFWNRGLSEIQNLFNETLELAKKLKKI